MPRKQIYLDELRGFNSKYNLTNFSIELLVEFEQNFGSAVDYLNDTVTEYSASENFLRWANKTLSICFDKKLGMREGAQYSLRGFNVAAFLTDFENLIEARYHAWFDDENHPEREVYDGVDPDVLIHNFQIRQERMNRSLPDLWKDRIKTGAMKIENMRTLTDNEVNALTSGKAGLANVNSKLTNVIAAQESMRRVRRSRGFFWRIFNFRKNRREREYYEHLVEQVNALRDHYDVERIRGTLENSVFEREILTEPAILTVSNAQPQSQRINANPISQNGLLIPNNPIDNNNARLEGENINGINGSQSASEILNAKLNMQFRKNLAHEIVGVLPGKVNNNLMAFAIEANMEGIVECLRDGCDEYEKQIEEGVSQREAIETYVLRIFEKGYEIADQSLNYKSLTDIIVAAQRITDKIVEGVLPCLFDKESLNEFTNGYVVKNADKVLEGMKQDSTPQDLEQVANAFNEAREVYGIKSKLDLKDTFADNGTLVKPIDNYNIIGAPDLKIYK